MAEIKQGSRAKPYAGINVLGAFAAGAGTPVGTGLQPEAEHMIRINMINLLSDIRRSELEINRQGLTSYSNILSSRLAAEANVISAFSNMARNQQMDRRTTLEMLALINGVQKSGREASGLSAPAETMDKIAKASGALRNFGEQDVGEGSIGGLLYRTKDSTQEQFRKDVAGLLENASTTYLNNLKPDLEAISNANALQGVDSKVLAELELATGVENILDGYILEVERTAGREDDARFLIENKDALVAQVVARSYQRPEYQILKATDREKAIAQSERRKKQEELEVFRRQVEDSQIAFPPALMDSLNAVYDQTDDIIALGPDGYAQKIQNMPAPVELSVARQRIENYIDEIDNPTDPLSASVARLLAKVPFVENYMAAMGFTSPLQTATYLKNNPEEFRQYYRIASRIGSTEDRDQLNDPMAIRERLRVAGSSNAGSLFRRRNLTKPIERLLGIGVNRRDPMRYLSGTNTEQQLEFAIQALRTNPEDLDEFVDEKVLEEAPQQEREDAATAATFARTLEPKKRERVARAAERFLSRITGDERDGSGDRFVLPGLTTEMTLEEEQPVQPQEPPATTERPPSQGRRIRGLGGFVRSAKSIEEENEAQKKKEAAARIAEERARLAAERKKAKEEAELDALAKAGFESIKRDSQVSELDARDIPDPGESSIDDEERLREYEEKLRQINQEAQDNLKKSQELISEMEAGKEQRRISEMEELNRQTPELTDTGEPELTDRGDTDSLGPKIERSTIQGDTGITITASDRFKAAQAGFESFTKGSDGTIRRTKRK